MSLVTQISALATRIATEFNTLRTWIMAREEQIFLLQSYGPNAVGLGQFEIGYPVPYNATIKKVRYWARDTGSGGTSTVELLKNGKTSPTYTISSSSGTPGKAGSAASFGTLTHNIDAGDMLYVYQTAVNSTTVGVELAAEIIIVRR